MWQAIVEDFSDLPDLAQLTRVTLRMLIAAILGGILGYEREIKGKQAGLRTHMLVSVGAAMFVLVPQQAQMSTEALSRVLQGLVAGIGFLGAGTIIRVQEQRDIQGLTTAANIWLTAAIGVAAGLGREVTAIIATLLALVILSVIVKFERVMERKDANNSKQNVKPKTRNDKVK